MPFDSEVKILMVDDLPANLLALEAILAKPGVQLVAANSGADALRRLLKVTPDEIQRVARWFIRPAQLSVVLVGDADKFVNDLKGVGFGNYERIPIERLDLMSADFLKR